MEYILRRLHQSGGAYGWLYLAHLLVGFHFFIIQYINSSFLTGFMSESLMGLLIAVGSALAVIALSYATNILAHMGAYHTALIALAVDYVGVFVLATASAPILLILAFVLHTLSFPVLLFCLDIFLENQNFPEERSGTIHGVYLSIGMLAALFSPVFAGYLMGTDEHFSLVYLASALFLLPCLAILHHQFRTFSDPQYLIFTPLVTLKRVWEDADLRAIAIAQFLMRFYFAWMVVYLPIYLNEHIGFSWQEIGLLLFLMLVPYILVEWPAGVLADKLLGEKELLILGFILAAVPTGLLVLTTSPSLAFWIPLLCLSRVGTALIESMTETYFFKHIGGHDADLMSVFRILRPLAFILGPLSATLVLVYVPIEHLWLILAGIMLFGVFAVRNLHDTR